MRWTERGALGAARRGLAAAAFLAAGAMPCGAQASEPEQGEWRLVGAPLAGWHFFGPVRVSVAAVLGLGTGDLAVPAPGSRFVLAVAEPGLRGGRLSLAYSQWGGFTGGVVARATALRFWAGAPARTYYGAEGQYVISVLPLGIRVGAFRPAERALDGTRRILWLADLSLMY